ncbi:hypothetical protein SAMN05216232_0193 [Virgibacillus subterraneus]|uniref:DUF3906 family protein n=1 Tax=Virgibacillus subterraneus TaxID=621109 RepID=A0A1H8YY10_9BACI|nr:hypothetical protein [Virgibacillus subterraneus]SEP57090.1 hypothetical protein SAMN05216232_0193 [Virgibacillus subterraneus]
MKVFVCNDHEGWWPVGSASVVIAENEQQAFYMLQEKLKTDYGINDSEFTLKEVDISQSQTIVLNYGDY